MDNFCFLCTRKSSSFVLLSTFLSEQLKLETLIEAHLPFVDISCQGSSLVCLQCLSTLKSFNELYETVKSHHSGSSTMFHEPDPRETIIEETDSVIEEYLDSELENFNPENCIEIVSTMLKNEDPSVIVKGENLKKKRHKNTHSLYICPKCHRKYIKFESFQTHMDNHEKLDGKKLECYVCKTTGMKTLSQLRKHIDGTHARGPKCKVWVCDICSHVCYTRGKWGAHRAKHKEAELLEQGKGVECTVCKKVFGTEVRLKVHFQQTHLARKWFYCEICSKSVSNLTSHMMTHVTPDEALKCEICGKTSKNKNTLNTHVRYYHRLKNELNCKYCPKTFRTKRELSDHLTRHPEDQGANTTPCEFCGKRIKGRSNYYKHKIKWHFEENEKAKKLKEQALMAKLA